jgi:hypothetical protein
MSFLTKRMERAGKVQEESYLSKVRVEWQVTSIFLIKLTSD